MAGPNSFGKEEKLKRKKLIDEVFGRGKAFSIAPLRVMYVRGALTQAGIQAGVSAPSRIFKKAHERNQVKRWLRESYRLQKAPLLERMYNANASAAVFFIYTAKNKPDYSQISSAMQQCLIKLENRLIPHAEAD